MKNMKAALGTFMITGLLASTAYSQGVPAPAPDTMILMGSDLFTNGASSNFQPALKQILDYYYIPGLCQATDDPMTSPDETDYATCDDLRFGLSLHAGIDCKDDVTDPDGPMTLYYYPDEDGGVDVDNEMMSIHGGRGVYYCGDDEFVNQDSALARLWEVTFPGSTNGPDGMGVYTPITDPKLDEYWERPHLSLLVTKAMPQTSNSDDGDRVIKAFDQACRMFDGEGVVTSAGAKASAVLPSMPTWVVSERRTNEDEALFGGMLAAAGGTAECEQKQGGNNWVPIDICEDIVGGGVTEATVRAGIRNGKYRCGSGTDIGTICVDPSARAEGDLCTQDSDCQGVCASGTCKGNCTEYSTGGGAADVLSDIRCLLSTQCAGNRKETDLLGLFACVRQVPRGVVVEDNLVVRYCENGDPDIYQDPLLPECGAEDPPGSACCNVLRESQGDIEFIDENRTLFVITDRDNCDGTAVDVFECPVNEYCDTGGIGRCAAGHVECPDNLPTCVPNFQNYPEICNGLDDDCDGEVDNISKSWDKPLYDGYVLDNAYAGLACDELDVCVCPGGATDVHTGGTFLEYQQNWSPVCECAEGLSPAENGPQSMGEPTDMGSEPQAGCSAAAGRALPGSFVGLFLLGLAGIVRRRR